MAEGGDRPAHIYQVNAQTIHMICDHTRSIRIAESNIGCVQLIPNNNEPNQNAEHLEADSEAFVGKIAREGEHRKRSLFENTQSMESPLSPNGGSTYGLPSLFESLQISNPPSGPGWVKLSETIFMDNSQSMKKGATVYRGKQKFAGGWRDVAVKLIPYSEEDFNEVMLHLKLEDHPNILRILDAGEFLGLERKIYIVMELCSQTLRDFIEDNKQTPMDFKQRYSFAKQIACGVAYIHKNRILHRDIKLDNLLLSASKETIRVADFGLSKQLLEGHSVACVSSRGLGSDGYRAPEVLTENPEASFRSDSFSIGIVFAMLFSNGQHPFGSDPLRWRTNIIDKINPNLSNIVTFKEPYAAKRTQLINLIKCCLRRNARDRPTPTEMLQHPFFSSNSGAENGTQGIIQDRIKFLKDELRKPLTKIGYQKSSELLEELQNLCGSEDLDILLQLAECHLHLMSEKKDSSIENVANFIITSGFLSALDVRDTAQLFYQQGHYVRAMILYQISHQMHNIGNKLSPNKELIWISGRVTDIKCTIEPLVELDGISRYIALNYGLKYMNDMLTELRSVKNASADVRVLMESRCLADIIASNIRVGEYEKAVEFGEAGIAMMKRQFQNNVSNYKGYGELLSHLGNAYHNSGQYSKAELRYISAVEASENALDFENERKRQEIIKTIQLNLNSTRRHLAQRE